MLSRVTLVTAARTPARISQHPTPFSHRIPQFPPLYLSAKSVSRFHYIYTHTFLSNFYAFVTQFHVFHLSVKSKNPESKLEAVVLYWKGRGLVYFKFGFFSKLAEAEDSGYIVEDNRRTKSVVLIYGGGVWVLRVSVLRAHRDHCAFGFVCWFDVWAYVGAYVFESRWSWSSC